MSACPIVGADCGGVSFGFRLPCGVVDQEQRDITDHVQYQPERDGGNLSCDPRRKRSIFSHVSRPRIDSNIVIARDRLLW